MDPRFRIPGGTLQYNPIRNANFPYIYQIPTHTLVHSEFITTILIRVVDTSLEARIAQANFQKALSVPLGPNADMHNYGQFAGLILFGYLYNFFTVTQDYSSSNRVPYCLPDRLQRMAYIMKKAT